MCEEGCATPQPSEAAITTFKQSRRLAVTDIANMERYDPEHAPDPAEWLDLDEQERLFLIERFHRRAGRKTPNLRLHAVLHSIVENQLALGEPPNVRATLDRLMHEGLSRHDAVHAIASVVGEHVHDILQGKNTVGWPADLYDAGLANLSASSWREG